ncbi:MULTISPECIES: HAD family hydrolase [unclassified Acinetobacter]|uniref:HAD family hydrolase n=1 Tax=unclassified Acinetobacter TaxID=196816 RepID=UPI0015D27FEA|nr:MULTISPECIES: HAD family hydrolase [unclassified Acinetobacter]
MSIRAVLFDLDNTLTHRDHSVQAYTQYLAESYQSTLVEVDLVQIKRIINRIDNGGYPKKELLTHPSIGASVAYALQTELSWIHQPDFDELTQFWFQHFGQFAVAMPGALTLLQQLKQQQYKLAVVSNGGHATRLNILNGLGFASYFDQIISSESAGISKPKVEIFQHSCHELGVMETECLFIGDHPVNDIYGASQAGMSAVLLEGFHALSAEQQHSIPNKIQHLDQVLDFLK